MNSGELEHMNAQNPTSQNLDNTPTNNGNEIIIQNEREEANINDKNNSEYLELKESIVLHNWGDEDKNLQSINNHLMSHMDEEYKYQEILDHYFKDGALIYKVKYSNNIEDAILDAPFIV